MFTSFRKVEVPWVLSCSEFVFLLPHDTLSWGVISCTALLVLLCLFQIGCAIHQTGCPTLKQAPGKIKCEDVLVPYIMYHTRVESYFRGNFVISELLIIANLKRIKQQICSDSQVELQLSWARDVRQLLLFTVGKLRYGAMRWIGFVFHWNHLSLLHSVNAIRLY